MKLMKTISGYILLLALLLSTTACGDTQPVKTYPENYERFSALLGESRETVLTQLNLTEQDLVPAQRGVYSMPVTAHYNGLTFDMSLEFDETNDRLLGFYYTKLWENEWDNAIRDVGSLAKALTQIFGEAREDVDPNRFSHMGQEELATAFAAKDKQVGTDYWLVEKRDDSATLEYVAIVREQMGSRGTIADHLNLSLEMQVNADEASGSAMAQLRFCLEPEYLTSTN